MLKTITLLGFEYIGLCGYCKNKYKMYVKGNIRVDLHVSKTYFKVIVNNEQIAYGQKLDYLKEVLSLYDVI